MDDATENQNGVDQPVHPVPIRVFDTTLRDGEQSPGASLNHQEKLEIARQLERLGVDIGEEVAPLTQRGHPHRAARGEVEGEHGRVLCPGLIAFDEALEHLLPG